MKKAAATRLAILQQSFELIYTKGYQSTSIDDIIATTRVTKGAFYYHFRNKDEMGVAIIEEVLKPAMLNHFIAPLLTDKDPADTIYKMIRHLLLENDMMKAAYGCPAGNLTQEMTPWNAAFTVALSALVDQWKQTLILCIDHGKKNGFIRKDVVAEPVALMIMSGYWGIRNLGKLYNSADCYQPYLKTLKSYLGTLK